MASPSIPKTMRAVKFQSKGVAIVEDNVPLPALKKGRILVKLRALALNPTDWKHIDHVTTTKGAVVGCDYAGDVVAVGEGVTKHWKVGDRVCGLAHGGSDSGPEDGAGGEYLAPVADLQMRIPDALGYEDAATLGVSAATVGQGFYHEFGFPWPGEDSAGKWKGTAVLVYGGSSATGLYAVQLAKLSGLEVHTTCSPRNFDLVKSLGADYVYDYNSPTCAADISKATHDSLRYAYDIISTPESSKICINSLAPGADANGKKSHYVCLGQIQDFPKDRIDYTWTLAYNVMGEEYSKFGYQFPARPDLFKHTEEVSTRVEALLASGQLKIIPIKVIDGGLDQVLPSLDKLRKGEVSGTKVVVKIA